MYAPPARAPTGFSFKRAGSSFSIRANNKKHAIAEPPPPLEDMIDAYDIPTAKLRKHLADVVFRGYSFEGDKIRLKGDKLILQVPRMLSETEKAKIYEMREPGAS